MQIARSPVTSERSHIEDPEDDGYEVAQPDEPEDLAAFGSEAEDHQDVAEEADSGTDEDVEGASLDELLAERAASKRASDDNDDDADIMVLATEVHAPATEPLTPVRVAPVRDREEFVCRSCHLVKPRVQLADAERGLCRDCA